MPHTPSTQMSLCAHISVHTHARVYTHTHTHTPVCETPQSPEGPRATTNLLTLEVADGKVIQRKEAPLPALALQ